MKVDSIIREMALRFSKIRSGLDVGFMDPEVSEQFRRVRGGVWMTVDKADELPYDDAQFDVVVANGEVVSQVLAREANRVLRPEGCLFFTVSEKTGQQHGYTPAEIYKMVREGFDIIALKRPKWWYFGLCGRTITVCARKKAWREHKGFIRGGSLPFTPFRSRS